MNIRNNLWNLISTDLTHAHTRTAMERSFCQCYVLTVKNIFASSEWDRVLKHQYLFINVWKRQYKFYVVVYRHRHQSDHECEKLDTPKPRMAATQQLVQHIIGKYRGIRILFLIFSSECCLSFWPPLRGQVWPNKKKGWGFLY